MLYNGEKLEGQTVDIAVDPLKELFCCKIFLISVLAVAESNLTPDNTWKL